MFVNYNTICEEQNCDQKNICLFCNGFYSHNFLISGNGPYGIFCQPFPEKYIARQNCGKYYFSLWILLQRQLQTKIYMFPFPYGHTLAPMNCCCPLKSQQNLFAFTKITYTFQISFHRKIRITFGLLAMKGGPLVVSLFKLENFSLIWRRYHYR